eukprot:COSAG03_NODE_790_length_5844_cov_46.596519_2_plen_58_part_00
MTTNAIMIMPMLMTRAHCNVDKRAGVQVHNARGLYAFDSVLYAWDLDSRYNLFIYIV